MQGQRLALWGAGEQQAFFQSMLKNQPEAKPEACLGLILCGRIHGQYEITMQH